MSKQTSGFYGVVAGHDAAPTPIFELPGSESHSAIRESFLGTQAVICSHSMRQLIRVVKQVANSNLSVLVVGESGTGKELVARAVHHCSSRSNHPWIDVNCGALPNHLFESELFGYEKGAFSGADASKPGLLELANSGTLFLDEVGELSPEVQVKLLRVLDGAPYYRLGGTRKINVNVRIVAATNQDMPAAIAARRFRLDLFHRLAQIQVVVPPLRERPQDIPALAKFFLEQERLDCVISADAMSTLQCYGWPGNVRELRNVVTSAAVLAGAGIIEAKDFSPAIRSVSTRSMQCQASSSSVDELPVAECLRLDLLERSTVLAAMKEAGGNRGHAAELLGISTKTLSRKLKSYKASQSREEKIVTMRPPAGLDRRRQTRELASGTTFLRLEGTAEHEFAASLRDVSSSGFRAAHDRAELAPGDKLMTDGFLGHHRAQVIWTRIVGKHIESGFVFIAPAGSTLA